MLDDMRHLPYDSQRVVVTYGKLRLHFIFYYLMRHESYGRRTTDVAVCIASIGPRGHCDRHSLLLARKYEYKV
jgi:hypothetical protein